MLIHKNNCYFQEIALANLPTNMNIGIFGGSFNPVHQGHLYIANEAIKKLNLNLLFLLVTPLNPLKNKKDTLELKERVNLCKNLTKYNHKIKVSIFEDSFYSYYSYDILEKIKKLTNSNNIIWIMGEDNLDNIDKFKRWQDFIKKNNIAVFRRKQNSFTSLNTLPKYVYQEKLFPYQESLLDFNNKKTLKFFHIKRNLLSSTSLRKK